MMRFPIEWNRYDSWRHFQIVWWCTSIFKLKCSLGGGAAGLSNQIIYILAAHWSAKLSKGSSINDVTPKFQIFLPPSLPLSPLVTFGSMTPSETERWCHSWLLNPLMYLILLVLNLKLTYLCYTFLDSKLCWHKVLHEQD